MSIGSAYDPETVALLRTVCDPHPPWTSRHVLGDLASPGCRGATSGSTPSIAKAYFSIQYSMSVWLSLKPALGSKLVTFAERDRIEGAHASVAAVEGAASRLRPILMTSCAMIAGMLPMAAGLGEGGSQTAPLGRAVIGGLIGATFATLMVLPAIFSIVQHKQSRTSGSLHPEDSDGREFRREETVGETSLEAAQ